MILIIIMKCLVTFTCIRRADVPGGAGRRAYPEVRVWHHHRALVVRETRQHDLFAEEQSSLPLEEEWRADTTTQILHQKGMKLGTFINDNVCSDILDI